MKNNAAIIKMGFIAGLFVVVFSEIVTETIPWVKLLTG